MSDGEQPRPGTWDRPPRPGHDAVAAAADARDRNRRRIRGVTLTAGLAGLLGAGVVAHFLPGSTHAAAPGSAQSQGGTATQHTAPAPAATSPAPRATSGEPGESGDDGGSVSRTAQQPAAPPVPAPGGGQAVSGGS